MYLKDIAEKLQDQIDVKPLLYICEQHINDTFKLKNNLKTKEMRLIAFKKQFNMYNDQKNHIEANLLCINSSLENISSNQEIIENIVRKYYQYILCNT